MRIGKIEIRKTENLHPDYKKSIEFAFNADGEDYYAFTNVADMPEGRYYALTERLTEMDMRINREDLVEYMDKVEAHINTGNFSKVMAIIEEIKYRASMLIETETLYKVASCVFFTLKEDLTTYDIDYNDKKIAIFKREKIESFFLNEPVKRFIPLPSISAEDLVGCLKLSEVRKRYKEYLLSQ